MITRTLNSNSASVSNAEDELDNERKILAQLNHQNIVSLVAALEGTFSGLGRSHYLSLQITGFLTVTF